MLQFLDAIKHIYHLDISMKDMYRYSKNYILHTFLRLAILAVNTLVCLDRPYNNNQKGLVFFVNQKLEMSPLQQHNHNGW